MEDCRIITSFYFGNESRFEALIGRLPYYYFLLLDCNGGKVGVGLEDCRIITSFYCRKLKTASYQRFLLFVVVEKSQQTRLFVRLLLFFVDEF